MSPLLEAARSWVLATYTFNSYHLVNTLEWLDRLAPDAREALRLAAITHDMERAFPGPDQPHATTLTDPVYNRLHAERSARIVGVWLRAEHADEAVTREVEALIVAHEVGGWLEADLLQAADSISFLDVNVDLALSFIESGRFSADDVRTKLHYSYDRIQVPAARPLARPLLDRALARLDAVVGARPAGHAASHP
jgi:hypothetical protein